MNVTLVPASWLVLAGPVLLLTVSAVWLAVSLRGRRDRGARAGRTVAAVACVASTILVGGLATYAAFGMSRLTTYSEIAPDPVRPHAFAAADGGDRVSFGGPHGLHAFSTDGGMVRVDGGGVFVSSSDGETVAVKSDAWDDAARRHTDRLQGEVTGDADFAPIPDPIGDDLPDPKPAPDWATTPPPAGRAVVSGGLFADPPDARADARRRAADYLADAAGVPAEVAADALRGPGGPVGRSAVETVIRTAGEHAFAVYGAHLQIDTSAESLDRLRETHRRRLGEERSAWAAGGAGALVALFGGLWGVGRRKLRRS